MNLKKMGKKLKEYGVKKCLFYSFKKLKQKIIEKKIKILIKKNKIKLDIKGIETFETKMKFYFSEQDKEFIRNFYKLNKDIEIQIFKDAEKIMKHSFDLLGSGEIELGNNIQWNQDFKSGFVWENIFYKEIKIVDLNNSADVKVPWELSRFQHLFTLGKTYWLTDDERYYLEFKAQILDWIEKNPVYMSVNWTCAMDVAIRAINWIFGYFLFEKRIKEDKEFINKFNNSLYWHGEFIEKNLEKGLGLANNHYLSDLNGLVFLGLYFKNSNLNSKAKKWLEYGIKELEKEMIIENNEDGTNYETSTSYHRLVTELMFYPALLLEKNNLEFSKKYKERLEKMFEFMAKITKPNGKVPLIGDVDNGRLVILSNYYLWEVSDFRNLISLGGEYFNNSLLKEVGAKELEDKLWIFKSNNKYKEEFYYKSIAFKDGGYYLLQNKDIYCLVRCGELSLRGQGGHSHNDQLSIELNIKGEDFIVDTGTGVYTADKNIRNLFRSTKMHNTVSIKDLEQNEFDENELFEMQEESFARCNKFEENYFKGEHYGYLNKMNLIHRRKIKLYDKNILIEDFIGEFEGIIHLNLAPEVKIEKTKFGVKLLNNNKSIFIKINENEYTIKNSKISTKYGKIRENKQLKIKLKKKKCINIGG